MVHFQKKKEEGAGLESRPPRLEGGDGPWDTRDSSRQGQGRGHQALGGSKVSFKHWVCWAGVQPTLLTNPALGVCVGGV